MKRGSTSLIGDPPSTLHRRSFLGLAASLPLLSVAAAQAQPTATDITVMTELVRFVQPSLDTVRPQPFAACVTRSGGTETVARALNEVFDEKDATAHAEVVALRGASTALNKLSLRGCTLYSTCEPCPMCCTAAIYAHIDRIVFGVSLDYLAQFSPQVMLHCTDIVAATRPPCKLVLSGGVEVAQCKALFDHPHVRQTLEKYARDW